MEKTSDPVLKRQTEAGATVGGIKQPELTAEEKAKIVNVNIEISSSAKRVGEIPREINELLKKQAVAGTPGNPNLTDEERAILREFYASRS